MACCSATPAPWASSAPFPWCPATSAARPTRCRCTSRFSTTSISSPRRSRWHPCWRCWRWSRWSPRCCWNSARQRSESMRITLQDVTRRFGAFPALEGVDLEIKSGELVALLGPSGSGKTTLLRIIAGLDWPERGEVRFDGEDALALSVGERNVGFVFQHYALFRHMTVFE